ncbi:hypothetical protein CC_2769 [Caulobacter vibrioides CB15]|uniref:Uncharacterized protein n=1 Tax=Caulobacter vibrioides (strain ATCC 19089 / CIP 103742 / CB 15) TaxID=190650 RepID=Q9A4R1_CAUVC|nr:hypothetical protein CC_2769 [Caulobacter vibrioides CB15]ATC29606.1 hypothetical protein CA607_14950 [Caulobacter vibrioides]
MTPRDAQGCGAAYGARGGAGQAQGVAGCLIGGLSTALIRRTAAPSEDRGAIGRRELSWSS